VHGFRSRGEQLCLNRVDFLGSGNGVFAVAGETVRRRSAAK